MSTDTVATHRRSLLDGTKYVARRAITMEIGIWQSLYRFVFRRPRVPADAVGFTYHRQVWTILMIFIGLSAFEIPIIDLIVHRWPAVRIAFLALGIWGLTWMIGLALGFITRPHAVGPEGIRVRNGAETDVPLRWDDVESVSLAKQSDEAKAPRVTVDDEGRRTLWMRMQNETNIEVALERTREIRLPSGTETVDVVRFWVDEPKDFLAEVRRHI
ncbi:MAG: hypothetical protein ABWX92_06290 [Mycetocola sp.]